MSDSSSSNALSELPENVAAALAMLFPPLSGIVFYIFDKGRERVRFHAMQNIFVGILFVAVALVLSVLGTLSGIPFVGIVFSFIVGILWLAVALVYGVVLLISIFNALIGKTWEIPYLGKAARQAMSGAPVDLETDKPQDPRTLPTQGGL